MKTNFNPWPYGIIVFFILLFCGIATVIAITATHPETMVSEDYYEQELKFQDRIDSTARAEKCGAHLHFDVPAGKLLVALPAAQVVEKVSGTIEFYRPSAPDLDCHFPLAPGADGSQSLDLSKLKPGLWDVRVSWSAGGQNYFLEQRLAL